MDQFKVIEARLVQKGDYLFNSTAPHPALKWVWVKDVLVEDDRVVIETSLWKTTKHPREAIAVRKRS